MITAILLASLGWLLAVYGGTWLGIILSDLDHADVARRRAVIFCVTVLVWSLGMVAVSFTQIGKTDVEQSTTTEQTRTDQSTFVAPE